MFSTAVEVEEKDEDVEPPVELCDVCVSAIVRARPSTARLSLDKRSKVTPVEGDHLCNACYGEVLDEIKDYIPHPGRSKPVCQLVGLAKDQKAFVI